MNRMLNRMELDENKELQLVISEGRTESSHEDVNILCNFGKIIYAQFL